MEKGTTPEWLQRHGGELRPSVVPPGLLVYVDGKPLYRLEVRPCRGRLSCAIVDLVSDRRIDPSGGEVPVYATEAEAFRGGLEQLRQYLGW